MNGRSLPPETGKPINTLAVLTATSSAQAGIVPDATYGHNVQQHSRSTTAEDFTVKVSGFETARTVTLSDGKVVTLQKPRYDFSGPIPANVSVRQAPQVIGLGLIEALDEATILAKADPNDNNGDGIRGIPNWSKDPKTGKKHLGRFGWKAGKGSLRHQTAQALLLDMGVTSSLYPTPDCQLDFAATACKTGTLSSKGLNNKDLDLLTNYIRLLGVPAQRKVKTEWEGNRRVPYEYEMDTSAIARGEQVFKNIQCSSCHAPEMKTGTKHPVAELRNQTIRPYSDFLVHDMGPGLADALTEGTAGPSFWRTQPLWGLGLLPYTQETAQEMADPNIRHGEVSRARYLHDGRARSLTEAILWHDGEAANSRTQFEGLSGAERRDLLAFLRSL